MTDPLVADETKWTVAPATFFCQDCFMTDRFNLEDFLPFRLNVLAQEVSLGLSAIYAERFSLDIPQWRILANLASRGEMTAQDIARVAFSHKSTVSRAVSELETRKLIDRKNDPCDGRAYRLRLTAKGKTLFAELLPDVLAYEKDILTQLKSSDVLSLLRGLTALETIVLNKE
jgi:DNA-binding MarR family transcriptional regulator